MIRGPSELLVLVVSFVFVGSSFAEEPKKENPEQRRERLRITVQAICPVSGESLTSHAKPVKMTDPETKEVLYVCCKDCLKSSRTRSTSIRFVATLLKLKVIAS